MIMCISEMRHNSRLLMTMALSFVNKKDPRYISLLVQHTICYDIDMILCILCDNGQQHTLKLSRQVRSINDNDLSHVCISLDESPKHHTVYINFQEFLSIMREFIDLDLRPLKMYEKVENTG